MNRGGYRRVRQRNYQQGQGPPQAGQPTQAPRQNGQEVEAPPTSASPPQQQQAKPKPNNTKPAGTTIETTTNESQA